MATSATSTVGTKGIVRQVIGPVLDVEFPAGKLPKILNALRIEAKNPAGQDVALTAEVQQLLGGNEIRALSMRSTDGLKRGVEAVDLGTPINVPVGTPTLGRIFNVIGEPVDEQGDVSLEEVSENENQETNSKIKIKIIPTKSFSCCPTARTPASPTIPMAIPAARPESPQQRPAAKCANPVYSEYWERPF